MPRSYKQIVAEYANNRETVERFLAEHPPTMSGVAAWLRDCASVSRDLMRTAWYLHAAELVDRHLQK